MSVFSQWCPYYHHSDYYYLYQQLYTIFIISSIIDTITIIIIFIAAITITISPSYHYLHNHQHQYHQHTTVSTTIIITITTTTTTTITTTIITIFITTITKWSFVPSPQASCKSFCLCFQHQGYSLACILYMSARNQSQIPMLCPTVDAVTQGRGLEFTLIISPFCVFTFNLRQQEK